MPGSAAAEAGVVVGDPAQLDKHQHDKSLPEWHPPALDVTGRRSDLPRGELDATAPVLSLRGADLRRGYLSLADALSEQPGTTVRQLSGFGATSLLSLRGSGSDQVTAFIDAVPVQSLDGTPLDLNDIALGLIDRIEVYRGMTPALLGAQSIGGTVRILTRMPRTPGGEVSIGAGSYGARIAEGVAGSGTEALRWTGSLRHLQSEGNYSYINDNGTIFDKSDDRTKTRLNNAVQRLGGSLGMRWQWHPRWLLDARYIGSGLRQGLPGLALYDALDPRLEQQRHLAFVALTGTDVARAGDRLRLVLQGSGTWTDVDDTKGELGLSLHTTQRMMGTGASLTYESAPWGPATLQGRAGVQRGQVDGHDQLKHTDNPASTRTTGSFGLSLPLHWEALNLDLVPSGGLDLQRSERWTQNEAPLTWHRVQVDEGRLWTARIGATWKPWQGAAIAAGWTRGLRAPTLLELFGNDGVIQGSARLRPENAQTFDGSVTLSGEARGLAAAMELAGFASVVDDLIQLTTIAQHRAEYENVSRARLWGVEATAHLRAGRSLHVWGQHTTLVARDASGTDAYNGKALPLRPRTRWSLRVEGSKATGPLSWSAWSGVQWQSGYFLDPVNSEIVPARTLGAVGVRAEHPRSGLYLDLRVDNILNEKVADLIGYPLPGRTFLASLGWRAWRDTAVSP